MKKPRPRYYDIEGRRVLNGVRFRDCLRGFERQGKMGWRQVDSVGHLTAGDLVLVVREKGIWIITQVWGNKGCVDLMIYEEERGVGR